MGYGRRRWLAGAFAGIVTGVLAVLAVLNWATVSKWACELDHTARSTFGLTAKHQFVEDDRQEPTCDEEGFIHYTCIGCDEEKQETLPMVEHTLVDGDNGVEPTCTESGLTDGLVCVDCGAVLGQEEIPALGHNVERYYKAPGCVTVGESYEYCTDCSWRTGSFTIGITGHSYQVTEEDEATCTVDGKVIYECSSCGDIKEDIVAAMGHNYIDGVCNTCGEVALNNLANWTMPVSEGYTVDGNKLAFAGTNELVFATQEKYNSISLTFKVSETQDVRGAFQIGWGAQSPYASINVLPYVQFNYDRAVLCLPDGTTYDTSWVTGENWRLTIDAENSNVILSVDGEVVYNVDASWWTQDNWGLPGYLVLRAESNCALTFELTEMTPIV